MSRLSKITLSLLALICLCFFWLWWNRPEKVDMAEYAPADTLIYLEANDLPEIVGSVVKTKTWVDLASASGLKVQEERVGWLTRLAELTGFGPAESVIFARAQIAVCVLGFGAAETSDTDLRINPRGAIIIETHTSNTRVRSAAEKTIGNFARRSFGANEARREQRGETLFLTWVAPDESRKKIIAAISGTLAIVSNDEASVEACLAVKRGERPSLMGDPQLREMRARVGADNALAFGFSPAGSAARIAEALSPLFSSQSSDDSRVQSLVAGLLPKLANRTLGSAAWSTRLEGGYLLDHYFFALPEGIASRLADAQLNPDAAPANQATDLLPARAYQVTFYRYSDPEAAWLSLNAALSTRVDAIHAPLVTLALEALLKPYGVDSPRDFLRACGAGIVTARLEEDSEGKVLIVNVKDRERLRELISASMGEGLQHTSLDEGELFISSDGAERRAAAFIAGYLILGSEEDVRACLSSRANNLTLSSSDSYRAGQTSSSDFKPHVVTATSDMEASRIFVTAFARPSKSKTFDVKAFRAALERIPYSVSETAITSEGVEKRTRSSFGLFGSIATRFTNDKEDVGLKAGN